VAVATARGPSPGLAIEQEHGVPVPGGLQGGGQVIGSLVSWRRAIAGLSPQPTDFI
jgi:hypothetical protein